MLAEKKRKRQKDSMLAENPANIINYQTIIFVNKIGLYRPRPLSMHEFIIWNASFSNFPQNGLQILKIPNEKCITCGSTVAQIICIATYLQQYV